MSSPRTPPSRGGRSAMSMMESLLGLLRIRVKRGVNLAVRDVRSSDPYVVVKMAKQVLLVLLSAPLSVFFFFFFRLFLHAALEMRWFEPCFRPRIDLGRKWKCGCASGSFWWLGSLPKWSGWREISCWWCLADWLFLVDCISFSCFDSWSWG